jgi:predicted GNAT family acetyltransferase
VGNIFTHPSYRGHGYATACTSSVCAGPLTQGLMVVLNVSVENTPALRLCQRLGFRKDYTYYEGIGTKFIEEKLDESRS